MKAFLYRPIPRMLRYELLMTSILRETPANHDDQTAIPAALESLRALNKDAEPSIANAKKKVELWEYGASLVFKPGEEVNMDLFSEKRRLICSGRLFNQLNTNFVWNAWNEFFCLLFDNYCKWSPKYTEEAGIN
jgi:RHO1 GDP-GTP exchange protein 1/2